MSDGLYLFETKTKGDIDELAIQRQMSFDLQTMLYLVAAQEAITTNAPCICDDKGRLLPGFDVNAPIVGVRFNVVRRPLSGGKGTIVRHKPTKANPRGETREEYYARLAEYFKEDPGHFFMRWNVIVPHQDVERFRHQFLDPALEQMCLWYDHVATCYRVSADPFRHPHGLHWRSPYVSSNPLLEGGSTEYDSYLDRGSEVGLRRVETLFPELESEG
jgi:hypothetical protein